MRLVSRFATSRGIVSGRYGVPLERFMRPSLASFAVASGARLSRVFGRQTLLRRNPGPDDFSIKRPEVPETDGCEIIQPSAGQFSDRGKVGVFVMGFSGGSMDSVA